MAMWLQAGLWGLLAGSALVIGAAVAYFANVPSRWIAAVMAFGSGVLISALSFDLMEEASRSGGFASTAIGFLAGAVVYSAANHVISHRGGHRRKHTQGQQHASEGGGLAIAVGSLLDGIPESVVIGVSLLEGHGVSLAALIAVFLSNVPEGLSSAAGMRQANRSASYIFGVWCGIAVICGIAAGIGNVALAGTSPWVISLTMATAAGAILAMLADTMIPEAFELVHDYAGLVTVVGFLSAFALSRLQG